jgi:hypothetical protein
LGETFHLVCSKHFSSLLLLAAGQKRTFYLCYLLLSFFTRQDKKKKSFQLAQIFEVEKKTAKMKSVLSKQRLKVFLKEDLTRFFLSRLSSLFCCLILFSNNI